MYPCNIVSNLLTVFVGVHIVVDCHTWCCSCRCGLDFVLELMVDSGEVVAFLDRNLSVLAA